MRFKFWLVGTLFFVLFSVSVSSVAHAAGFTAVWRPSETAPSVRYDYFYVIQEETGDVFVLYTLGQEPLIVNIVKLANIYTGQLFNESLTAKWVMENERRLAEVSRMLNVPLAEVREFYTRQFAE